MNERRDFIFPLSPLNLDLVHMRRLLNEMPFLTAPYNWRSILLSKIQEEARKILIKEEARKSSRKGSAKEKRASWKRAAA